MNYLSVCSGIEAATVAWAPLRWEASGFSEIEPFPCSVLAHHYPDVPNYGDMTNYREWEINGNIRLICGGTPCQSFSVAGLRAGLDDPRGNLALVFQGIVDRFKPRWVVWENVPGVLSDRGNAFGQFVTGLSELGYGVMWRVLDAQYFGVPQRRRRVFVIGYFGDWRPAAAVLFERESLRWDITPSKKARKRLAGTVRVRASNRCGDNEQNLIEGVAPTVSRKWAKGTGGPSGDECQNLVAQQVQWASGGGKILNDTAQALRSGAEHNYQFVAEPVAFNGDQSAKTRSMGESINQSPSIRSGGPVHVATEMRVRRLTPTECARLQGFPDDYLDIIHKGKPASDSAKYKAFGNSMAVPVMRWLGERIQMFEGLFT